MNAIDAASGGLDSITITKWLTDHGVKVVCMTADFSQPDEQSFDNIKFRMLKAGARDFIRLDLRNEIAEAGIILLQALARYEGKYWNTSAVSRHLIVNAMIGEMRKKGLSILGHGASGRGNDQIRLQLVANMLAPDIEIYAPWRDKIFLSTFKDRRAMVEYCCKHSLPTIVTGEAPYSFDANLLGFTHEGGELDSLHVTSSIIKPRMGQMPKEANDTSEVFTVQFEQGIPTWINNRKVNKFEAIETANKIGGRHGIGIGTHLVENQYGDLKSRNVYEAPGMELLGICYQLLLEPIIDRRARELFDLLSSVISRQIYQGYWFDTASRMAFRGINTVSELITGKIVCRTLQRKCNIPSSRGCETFSLF